MLSELCGYLNNYFDRVRAQGKYTITGGVLDTGKLVVLEGQYIRIVGSVLNDGVYRYPMEGLKDETFDGAIWLLAIPQEVIALSEEITAWREKYETADSAALSPFLSESFGGYSYSKGTASGQNNASGTWADVFGGRLAQWVRIRSVR